MTQDSLTQNVVRRFLASKFAYHGTNASALSNVRRYGLVPGAASSYTDRYSEYDDGAHLFFSDDPDHLRGAYGDTILRFPWPSDTKPDQNVYGRFLSHQFVTKKKIPAENITVEVDGSWVALRDLQSE